MRFRGTFELLSFDLNSYHERLDAYFEREVLEGARRFLGVATTNIPVWSGASLGTFKPLAREANYPILLSSQPGARNSSPPPTSVGEIVTDKRRGLYSFEYSTDLAHLVFNEFHNANITPDATLFGRLLTPGPYGAMAKGQQAVRRQMLKRPSRRFGVNSKRSGSSSDAAGPQPTRATARLVMARSRRVATKLGSIAQTSKNKATQWMRFVKN